MATRKTPSERLDETFVVTRDDDAAAQFGVWVECRKSHGDRVRRLRTFVLD